MSVFVLCAIFKKRKQERVALNFGLILVLFGGLGQQCCRRGAVRNIAVSAGALRAFRCYDGMPAIVRTVAQKGKPSV